MNKATLAPQAKTAGLMPPSQGMLQRKCACGSHTSSGGECEECAKKKNILQRKLTIGASNDPLELEADRVAEQVMTRPLKTAVSVGPPHIQRVNRQLNGGLETAPTSVDQVLASSGRPLEPALRQDMESRFGQSFSQVRLHTGSTAEQSARDVSAHAYTVGHNIVFGSGRFSPHTYEGQRLIAHELTHVLQQSGGDAGVFSPITGANESEYGRAHVLQPHSDSLLVQREAEATGGRQVSSTSLSPQGLDATLEAIRTASLLVPGLAPLIGAFEIIRGVVYFWNHRHEHLRRLLDSIGNTVGSVPALARVRLNGFLQTVTAGPAAEAGACIGEQLILFLESLAQNWREIIESFIRDMVFVGLFERSLPSIIDNISGLVTDLANREFRSAIDRGVAIMTEINAIAGVLFLWFALITTVLGAAAGSEVPVAGNAAGAAAGLTLAEVVGIGLVASVVATETVRVGRGIDEMNMNWGNILAREAGCRQVAEGVFALTLTAALFFLGPGIQRIARSIISRAAVAVRSAVTATSAAMREASAALEVVTARPALVPAGSGSMPFAGPELTPQPVVRGPVRAPPRPVPPAIEPPRRPTPARARPTRAPMPTEPAPDSALRPDRRVASGLVPATEEPSRRADACRNLFGLLPGNNDRWHRQRPAIGVNTTVDSAAFRLDAGRPAPVGQPTDPPSRAWARGIGYPSDDAGHVIARRFGGTRLYNSPNGNIFPQQLTINRGRMVVRDREAAELHGQGCDVCVHIQLNYDSASDLRPNALVHSILVRRPGTPDFVPPSPPEIVPNP